MVPLNVLSYAEHPSLSSCFNYVILMDNIVMLLILLINFYITFLLK